MKRLLLLLLSMILTFSTTACARASQDAETIRVLERNYHDMCVIVQEEIIRVKATIWYIDEGVWYNQDNGKFIIFEDDKGLLQMCDRAIRVLRRDMA